MPIYQFKSRNPKARLVEPRNLAGVAHLYLSRTMFAALILSFCTCLGQAQQAWERLEPARELLNGAQPKADGIHLDLPAVTQDGSSVSLTVEVESPMSAEDNVEALYLFAAGNPTPELAEFHFTPLAGQAKISTRIRLDSTQRVVALARTSQGEWLTADQEVRVTVSGCISTDDPSDEANFMQARVRAPDRMQPDQPGEIRTLMTHPMETGLRKDDAGQLIPEKIISEFHAALNGEQVMSARFYRAIAANPYLLFHIAPGHSGHLELEWREDTGQTATATAEIPAA